MAAIVSIDQKNRVISGTSPEKEPSWQWDAFAGRLTELSAQNASALLTVAFDLVLEAQERGEPVAWASLEHSHFYPPDVATTGIDLQALLTLRVRTAQEAARAIDRLLRSGALGLGVLDLGRDTFIPDPLLTRLVGLCQKHRSSVVFLTQKPPDSLSVSPLVSLRAQVSKQRASPALPGLFTYEIDVLKDKRRGPGWSHEGHRHGPPGLH